MSQQEGVGITVEAGSLTDIHLASSLEERMKAILVFLNMIPGEIQLASFSTNILDVYQNVIATPGFKWQNAWENFQSLPEGTIFAIDKERVWQVEQDSVIIFTKNKPQVGQEACLLATHGLEVMNPMISATLDPIEP